VAAVENRQFAGGGRLRMHAPQKIVCEFDGCRRLERHDAQTEWIDIVKHRADRAVLAARVHALQH
jgi:SH3-like domain-containing protein